MRLDENGRRDEDPEAVPPAGPPRAVRWPVTVQHWDHVTFLHWPFQPETVAPLIPSGLELSTFDGAAWVSVTPLCMRVRPLSFDAVPAGWTFPETNVRTYVTGPGGGTAVLFLHIEAGSRWFSAALRTLGLPYVAHRMRVDRAAGTLQYRAQPARGAGGCDITVIPGRPMEPSGGPARDRFLTARWSAFHRRGSVLLRTPIEHETWPLRHAEVPACQVGALFARAGLPAPTDSPLAAYARGVTARVGLPRLVR